MHVAFLCFLVLLSDLIVSGDTYIYSSGVRWYIVTALCQSSASTQSAALKTTRTKAVTCRLIRFACTIYAPTEEGQHSQLAANAWVLRNGRRRSV